MSFLRPGMHQKPELSRARTRRKPLLALAALPLAGFCALPIYTAYAQKAASGTPPVKDGFNDPRTAPKGSGTAAPGPTSPIVTPAPPNGIVPIITPITPIITPIVTPRVIASPASVLQYRYDNARSGVYDQSGQSASPATILQPQKYTVTNNKTTPPTTTTTYGVGTLASVTNNTAFGFGKRFTRQLDGISYGQPLYYYGLGLTNAFTGAKSTHNVIFVATNNNSVYAFDADNTTGANGSPLWRANFNSVANNIGPTNGNDITDIFGLPQADIQPLIGIVGTPVIDSVNNILYVVVRTTEGASYAHRLHAIDITTGLEESFSPQLIGQQEDAFGNVTPITVPGIGDDPYDDTHIFFDTTTENQRAALTLVNGNVYVAYGSFSNSPPYHGWMFSFNAANLQLNGVFCTTPNATTNSFDPTQPPATGGIDMSGVGPAYDLTTDTTLTTPASLYFTTGLGVFDNNADYGQSVLKLKQTPTAAVAPELPTLSVLSSFTPYNIDNLNAFGQDLGTGGVALLPNNTILGYPHAMLTAGVEGTVYLLSRDNLGGFNTSDNIIAKFPAFDPDPTAASLLGPSYGVPAVYTDKSGATPTTTVYYHAAGDVLRPFTLNSVAPYLLPSAVTGNANFGYPGAMPVISTNNGTNAIIWELEGVSTRGPGGGFAGLAPIAVLHAYDANPLNADLRTGALRELFNSSANGGGANVIGDYTPFSMPLAANGKVYVTAGVSSGGNTNSTGGLLVVFGPPDPTDPTNPPPTTTEGYHYHIAGPLVEGFVGTNLLNYYSITAFDANYNPVKVTARNVHMSLTDGTTGRIYSLGDVSFDGTSSYVIFSRAVSVSGSYSVLARDESGNTSDAATLSVGSGTAFNIGFFGVNPSFDHFTLRVPPAARDGALTTISITPVDARGTPIIYTSTVDIYDTLPSGAPGGDYEFQTGGAYPTVNGSGTYSVQFNGVGKHIVAVTNLLLGFFPASTSTAVVNVVSSGGGAQAPGGALASAKKH